MGGPGSDSPLSPPFDLDRFHDSLHTHAFGRTLRYSASTASTNADALEYLQQWATIPTPHGFVILADCQTAGRGRRGRTWHSPPQGNLYFSVVVVPQPVGTRITPWLTWVPLLSALAGSDCLSQQTGLSVSVKWPNDLLIHDKKVGGILCEQTTTADRTMAIIIGIGLNINAPLSTFPEKLQPGATTLAAEAGQTCDRVAILADLLLRLEQRLDRLFHDGPAGMIEEFTQRCSTIGKIIRVTLEEQGMVQGIAESIGPDGCLRLRVASNESPAPPSTLLEVRSAEVVHLRG
ncbi:MAG: biotin--[acetyl-CoA-carboxylase] ligase [Nitrospira sp.]|nr:biotin--[acetyl-CoA-carboxylase] ligase [Nitrospira sp.]